MSDELVKRIQEKCAGRDRWYVMNAAEDGYCMDFDWGYDADRWMDDRLRENPDYIKRNGYHVVKKRSFTSAEELANEAAALIEQQAALMLSLESRIAQQSRTIAAMCQQVADLKPAVAQAVDAQPVATKEPAHKFAIIRDRNYDGEGLSLWTWDGEYYVGADGDCLSPDPDGTLDGYTAEWLTDYQLEMRLNDASAQSEGLSADLSLRALYEDACIKANKNAQDAARWRYAVRHWLDEHIATKQADEAIAALSKQDPQ
jgi:hypothetical protein